MAIRTLVQCGAGLAIFTFSSVGRAQSSPANLPDLKLSTGGFINALAVQPDGRIIAGGLFTAVNGVSRRNLVRLNPDGEVDPLWRPDPDGVVSGLALGPESVYVVGRFFSIGGQDRSGLAKVALAGRGIVDPIWNPAFETPSGSVYEIALSGSVLYVGGAFERIGGLKAPYLARLSVADEGLADPNWIPDADNAVNAIVIDPEYIYAGGDFERIGRKGQSYLARLNRGTAVTDPTWEPAPDGTVSALAVTGGYVYVGGQFTMLSGEPCLNAGRVDKDLGLLDPLWLPQPDDRVTGFLPAGDEIFVFGRFDVISDELRHGLARVSAVGPAPINPLWAPLLEATVMSPVSALAVSGENIYVGGGFHYAGDALALGLVKLDWVTAEPDTRFQANAQQPGEVKAIQALEDGRLIVGGDFYFAATVPRENVAMLNADGTLDDNWHPRVNGPVFALAARGNDVYLGGSFTTVGGMPRRYLARLNTLVDDGADLNWDPSPQGGYMVSTLSLGEKAIYVGGAFERIGGQARRNLARVTISELGSVDPFWAPDGGDPSFGHIDQVTVVGEDVYVAGSFAHIGGQLSRTLARISVTGTGQARAGWAPNPPEQVTAFVISGAYLYAAAGHQLLRISTLGAGEIDGSWLTLADDYIRSIATMGQHIYVGGNFTSIGGQARKYIARFAADSAGAADANWDRPIEDAFAPIVSLLAVTNGVYAGGAFTIVGGSAIEGLAFFPELAAPSIAQDTTSLFILPNAANAGEVTHFRITGLDGISLFLPDEVTPVRVGDFITTEQGYVGLPYYGSGTVTAVAALNDTPEGAGTDAAAVLNVGVPLRLSAPLVSSSGSVSISLEGGPQRVFSILATSSLNPQLQDWTEILRLTNTTGVTVFSERLESFPRQRCYRAREVLNSERNSASTATTVTK